MSKSVEKLGFLLIVIVFALSLAQVSFAEKDKERETKMKDSSSEKVKVKGARIKGNKIKAKKGYKLQVRKVEDPQGRVQEMVMVLDDTANVTGTVACTCSKNGSCTIEGTPSETQLNCVSTNCSGNCTISIVLDPPPAPEP